ncbi:hypothetical protein, partial [Methylobacterium gnaphalii]|uniref:hypothetical protein n=1 Tax=Methylobacterium gnaphalii TaxID=1010610 RepID=UPI0024E0F17E
MGDHGGAKRDRQALAAYRSGNGVERVVGGVAHQPLDERRGDEEAQRTGDPRRGGAGRGDGERHQHRAEHLRARDDGIAPVHDRLGGSGLSRRAARGDGSGQA